MHIVSCTLLCDVRSDVLLLLPCVCEVVCSPGLCFVFGLRDGGWGGMRAKKKYVYLKWASHLQSSDPLPGWVTLWVEVVECLGDPAVYHQFCALAPLARPREPGSLIRSPAAQALLPAPLSLTLRT